MSGPTTGGYPCYCWEARSTGVVSTGAAAVKSPPAEPSNCGGSVWTALPTGAGASPSAAGHPVLPLFKCVDVALEVDKLVVEFEGALLRARSRIRAGRVLPCRVRCRWLGSRKNWWILVCKRCRWRVVKVCGTVLNRCRVRNRTCSKLTLVMRVRLMWLVSCRFMLRFG